MSTLTPPELCESYATHATSLYYPAAVAVPAANSDDPALAEGQMGETETTSAKEEAPPVAAKEVEYIIVKEVWIVLCLCRDRAGKIDVRTKVFSNEESATACESALRSVGCSVVFKNKMVVYD
jgi:hypothetical protein